MSRSARLRRVSVHLFVVLFLYGTIATAQTVATSGEQAANRALAATVKIGTPATRAFLRQMPKGTDLHMHLSGAVYAETFLQNAAQDNLCIDVATKSLSPNHGVSESTSGSVAVCDKGDVPAANVFTNQSLYDALIDSFSMRAFVPSAGVSGHDQFFATFDRFRGINKKHVGEWLDEVATRAAAQNEQYLEVMHTPDFSLVAAAAGRIGWHDDMNGLFQAVAGDPLRENVKRDVLEINGIVARRTELEHCDTPNATAACKVEVRFIFQGLRALPPAVLFGQMLLGFELANTDSRVVGVNLVQPEDGYASMSSYHLTMRMMEFLHNKYPKVHITLHAGELAPGMVPPDGLSFHIREAVEVAHAERIGHGVDVMGETDPKALLKEMAEKHVMVEINITSNDGILGIKGHDHPLPSYRAAKVPVALATDDEGVSRIDLTNEYTRAAMELGLTYSDLKNMARTGMEHSFIAGESLWALSDVFTRTRSECAAQSLGAEKPAEKCAAFLKANERAQQQWELERRFRVFEASAH